MTLNLKPHEYRRKPDSSIAVLTRLNPYVRMKRLDTDEPPIFIQGGAFMFEDGQEIPKAKLPPWALEEVKKLSKNTRKEVGLADDKD